MFAEKLSSNSLMTNFALKQTGDSLANSTLGIEVLRYFYSAWDNPSSTDKNLRINEGHVTDGNGVDEKPIGVGPALATHVLITWCTKKMQRKMPIHPEYSKEYKRVNIRS